MVKSKEAQQIKQIFINLTNTRGLLWTDELEGILFDRSGLIRIHTSLVRIDPFSLATILHLNSQNEIVNYIIVLDYLVDYLKNEFDLSSTELSILLKEYLTQCKVVNFDMLKGPIGSWVISTNLVIEENFELFKRIISGLFLWSMSKNMKISDYRLKRYLLKINISNIDNMVWNFIKKYDKYTIKRLLTFSGGRNNKLWKRVTKDFVSFIKEKKNSPTSS